VLQTSNSFNFIGSRALQTFLTILLTERPSGDSMCQNCWQQRLYSLVSVNIIGTSVFWF
jgi:hypothetical protein